MVDDTGFAKDGPASPSVARDDTYDLIDDAVAALAERRSAWLGVNIAAMALIASLIDQAERGIPGRFPGFAFGGDDDDHAAGSSHHSFELSRAWRVGPRYRREGRGGIAAAVSRAGW